MNPTTPSARPHPDTLERPDVPTTSFLNGNLVILGTGGHDNVLVRLLNGRVDVVVNGRIERAGLNPRSITGRIEFHGFGGNDRLTVGSPSNPLSPPVVAYGG